VNLEKLTGLQTRILREAILSAFNNVDSLNAFLMQELDKQPLDVLAGGSTYDERLLSLLQTASAEGWLSNLISRLQAHPSRNALLRNLPDALRLGDANQNAVTPNAEMSLERMASAAGSDLGVWAARMSEIGEATCQIEVQLDHEKIFGTGFLVADDLVLTNYHLVKDHILGNKDPARIGCRFDYAMDVEGRNPGELVPLVSAPTWLAAYSPHDEADFSGTGGGTADHLDFALLRLNKAVGKQDMGNGLRRGRIKFANPPSPIPVADDPVFIVQYPRDKPLTMSVGTVLGMGDGGARLRYEASTEGGSSGSAVFDEQSRLVALHQIGDSYYNQGILIGKIVAMVADKIDLSAVMPEIYPPPGSAPAGSGSGRAGSSLESLTWPIESTLNATEPVSGESLEPPGVAPKRSLNAWIDNPAPTVGKPFRISINIGAPTGAEFAQAAFGEPDWRGIDSIDLIVTVSSINCTTEPGWHELVLRRTGDSDTINFVVTASVVGSHEFTVGVYLARQMIRLQSLSFKVTVATEQLQRAGAAS
jgi:Trypsin-like peptidase domain/Effector-associated domain 1